MSSATIAAQMTGADFLKLRKKRGVVVWALVLALLPLVAYFVVAALQHSSDPAQHGPAGGVHGFTEGLRAVSFFFGPLAAILIGVEAGAGDLGAGIFRDLVVTGRSRLALFATRVPAALALCWLVIAAAFGVLLIGTFAFASGSPEPSATLILNGLGFTILTTGVICAVAVGFAALTASRPTALTALIGWVLVASPIIVGISSLGSSRKLVLSDALANFSPVPIERGGSVAMSHGLAAFVTAGWLAVMLGLGAWRTRTMDA
jgi:ABC-type transport system involved in multi-copper enzyme maturation permease subunit